jgi:hypothetical protein
MPIHIDELILSKDSIEVYQPGNAISPKIQPLRVRSWDSFSVDENTTGAWLGVTSYEAQYSTDGGVNWGNNPPVYTNGNWEKLTNANLQGVVVDGDGQDALRIRVNHSPDSTISHNNSARKTWIPKTNQIIINFTPRRPFRGSGLCST